MNEFGHLNDLAKSIVYYYFHQEDMKDEYNNLLSKLGISSEDVDLIIQHNLYSKDFRSSSRDDISNLSILKQIDSLDNKDKVKFIILLLLVAFCKTYEENPEAIRKIFEKENYAPVQ